MLNVIDDILNPYTGKPIADPVVCGLITKPRIAERRSGSNRESFYRPQERPSDGAPFNIIPTKCPPYQGRPKARDATIGEINGAWQLQEEYLADRLGKDVEENSRLWNTAKWIDKHYRIATMPAQAVSGMNLITGRWEEHLSSEEIFGSCSEDEEIEASFGQERFSVDRRTKESVALKLSDQDLISLADYFKEHDKLTAIDINKLALNANPLPERIDLPKPIDRTESGKIIRMLMLGMRSLWRPVIRAIADHATMKALGKTQNVGDGVAASVGRTRIIEGLRVADSIKKRLARSKERPLVDEDRHWPARLARQRHMAFMDKFISEILAVVAENPLAANDNCPVEALAREAA
jgi:hypothetical protein